MLTLKDDQQVELRCKPKSAAGNPAKVDGVPEWTSSDESVITVQPAADGMTCMAVTTGKLTDDGSAVQIRCTADADLGQGTNPIAAVESIQVMAGDAVVVGIEAGEPTSRPT